MRVLSADHFTHIIDCHPKIKAIKNVSCEQINIEIGLMPLFLSICYQISKLLTTGHLVIHDVVYKEGLLIQCSVVLEPENIDLKKVLSSTQQQHKEYCGICAEKLVALHKGRCIKHRGVPSGDVDIVQSQLQQIELTLYKLIEQADHED